VPAVFGPFHERNTPLCGTPKLVRGVFLVNFAYNDIFEDSFAATLWCFRGVFTRVFALLQPLFGVSGVFFTGGWEIWGEIDESTLMPVVFGLNSDVTHIIFDLVPKLYTYITTKELLEWHHLFLIH
jgi:hypothetical protein